MSTQLPAILHQAGVLSAQQMEAVQQHIDSQQVSAPQALLDRGLMTSRQLSQHCARLFSLPLITLDDFDYAPLCQQLGVSTLILKYHALPLQRRANGLTLALSDPGWPQLEEEFRFATGLIIEPVLTDQHDLQAAIRHLYGHANSDYADRGQEEISPDQLAHIVQIGEEEPAYQLDLSQDEAPVSRFIHQVLLDAVRKQASDIHFEPYESNYRIRVRCDGILIQTQQPAAHLSRRLAARLKILARLDIAQRRLPQDGRIKLRLNSDYSIDMRVSTLPTLWGEKIVLRLLDNQTIPLDLQQLGYNEVQQQLYLAALRRPQGMILITGPTGSGKTVSLYCGLQRLNQEQLNIATAEDPVEINLHGINQVQVDPAIGFGFAEALRTFLRQDPDVLMVGEIRDRETADVAMKAAQTGHLVLSTLHTNSAAETLVRLTNMGIEPFNLAASLSLIIAQRLVRRLCPHCKVITRVSTAQAQRYNLDSHQEIFEPNSRGCAQCNRGYAGRIGLYEVMPIDSALSSALLQGQPLQQLESIACHSGMQTLQQNGLNKLLAGTTSLSELQRILGVPDE